MKSALRRAAWLAALLSVGAVQAQSQNLPSTVTRIVDGPDNGHAFGAAAFLKTPVDLAAVGYTEEEYAFSGQAGVYRYEGNNVEIAGVGNYTDRMLIRRPTDPARFSGNVVFEAINGTINQDGLVGWTLMSRQIIHKGDIWVGISSAPLALQSLRNFNAARYGKLAFNNAPGHCGELSGELGLIYDVLTQSANLLRQSDLTRNPLYGLPVRRIYAFGYSQPALILTTYLNSIVPNLPQEPFDGYLVTGGSGTFALSSCTNLVEASLHGQVPRSKRAPVFQIQTPAETGTTPIGLPSQADSDAADNRYRLYEIAGPTHVSKFITDRLPLAQDQRAATGYDMSEVVDSCRGFYTANTFPANYVFDNLLAKLEDWVELGAPPPHAQPLNGGDSRRGGVRSPAVDVPTADYVYGSFLTPLYLQFSTVALLAVPCSWVGTQNNYSPPQLAGLYPTHDAYVQKVAASADQLLQAGFLTDYDARQIVADAQAAKVAQ